MEISKSYAKLLYAAPVLYSLYGLARYYLLGEAYTFQCYAVVNILDLMIAIWRNNTELGQKIPVKNVFHYFFINTMINEHVVSYLHDYQIFDMFSLTVLCISITYTFWMKSLKENMYVHLLATSSFFLGLVLNQAVEHKVYVGLTFLLLATWKFSNDFYIKRYYQAFEKDNKYKAFKETVGLLNHEFNNISTIALLLLRRKKKEQELDEKEKELESVLLRMSQLVQDLNELKDYKSEKYSQEISITKLKD
jgi:hypothetical protein